MFDRIMSYLRGPAPIPESMIVNVPIPRRPGGDEVKRLWAATDDLLTQYRAGAISPVDATRLERNRLRLGELGIHIVLDEEEEEEEAV